MPYSTEMISLPLRIITAMISPRVMIALPLNMRYDYGNDITSRMIIIAHWNFSFPPTFEPFVTSRIAR